jgi:hypothetical protein
LPLFKRRDAAGIFLKRRDAASTFGVAADTVAQLRVGLDRALRLLEDDAQHARTFAKFLQGVTVLGLKIIPV